MTKNTDLKELEITSKQRQKESVHSNKPQAGQKLIPNPLYYIIKVSSFSQKLQDMWKNKTAQSREDKNKADNQRRNSQSVKSKVCLDN